jgi:hypothetical protein
MKGAASKRNDFEGVLLEFWFTILLEEVKEEMLPSAGSVHVQEHCRDTVGENGLYDPLLQETILQHQCAQPLAGQKRKPDREEFNWGVKREICLIHDEMAMEHTDKPSDQDVADEASRRLMKSINRWNVREALQKYSFFINVKDEDCHKIRVTKRALTTAHAQVGLLLSRRRFGFMFNLVFVGAKKMVWDVLILIVSSRLQMSTGMKILTWCAGPARIE